MSGLNVAPTKVAFAHNRNSDVREFERFFGCPVEFGAPNTVFQISANALRLPLITADPKLLRVLRPYCDAAAKERNVKPGTLRSAVKAEVEKLLPHGKAKAENVAKVLALSLRTLGAETSGRRHDIWRGRRPIAEEPRDPQFSALSRRGIPICAEWRPMPWWDWVG